MCSFITNKNVEIRIIMTYYEHIFSCRMCSFITNKNVEIRIIITHYGHILFALYVVF